jgi:3-isopropylmalate/(R)-2-methylmalate dehydratase large subunit
MAEKILSSHCGRTLRSGDIGVCSVDFLMGTDSNGPGAMDCFESLGRDRVLHPDQVAFVLDHMAPCPTAAAANVHKRMTDFCSTQNIKLYRGGNGICHQVIPEHGHVLPGQLVVGTDSHTTTYGALNAFATGIGATEAAVVMATGRCWFRVPESIQIWLDGRLPARVTAKDLVLTILGRIGTTGALYNAIEFAGPGVATLSIDERLTICNMAVEAGAKAGIMPCDEETIRWLASNPSTRDARYTPAAADECATYAQRLVVNLEDVVPVVARPHSPADVVNLVETEGLAVDQVHIGSCTNGRASDFRLAAEVLAGRSVKQGLTFNIAPASRRELLQLVNDGTLQVLLDAGATLAAIGCGCCGGYHSGIPADGAVVFSTTNRNFRGRMGNAASQIYLGSPASAAAAALTGRITDPRGC